MISPRVSQKPNAKPQSHHQSEKILLKLILVVQAGVWRTADINKSNEQNMTMLE